MNKVNITGSSNSKAIGPTSLIKKLNMTRFCGTCSKCCEGWLFGEAYGHRFYKGRKCFFLDKHCTIYEDRPDFPCKTFVCEWLGTNIFPMWMKPELSNVIISKDKINNIEYYNVTETGVKMDSSVLNWLLLWSINENQNIKYTIDNGVNYFGSKEFFTAMDKLNKTKP